GGVGRADHSIARHGPPRLARRAATRVAGWTSYSPLGPGAGAIAAAAPPAPEDELLALLRLGGGLPERLVGGVASAWSERLMRGEAIAASARAQLQAALYGRVVAALCSWLGEPDAEVEGRMIDPDARQRAIHSDPPFPVRRAPSGRGLVPPRMSGRERAARRAAARSSPAPAAVPSRSPATPRRRPPMEAPSARRGSSTTRPGRRAARPASSGPPPPAGP